MKKSCFCSIEHIHPPSVHYLHLCLENAAYFLVVKCHAYSRLKILKRKWLNALCNTGRPMKGHTPTFTCAPGLQVWKSIVFNYLPPPSLLPYASWKNLPPHPLALEKAWKCCFFKIQNNSRPPTILSVFFYLLRPRRQQEQCFRWGVCWIQLYLQNIGLEPKKHSLETVHAERITVRNLNLLFELKYMYSHLIALY